MIYLSDDGAYDEATFLKREESKCQAHVGAYNIHQKEVRLAKEAAEYAEWQKSMEDYW